MRTVRCVRIGHDGRAEPARSRHLAIKSNGRMEALGLQMPEFQSLLVLNQGRLVVAKGVLFSRGLRGKENPCRQTGSEMFRREGF